MRTLARLSLLVLALLVLVLAGGGAYVYGLTRPAGGKNITLEIKPGATLAGIAGELQRRGIVKSADALRLIMRARGTAGDLRDGLYDLKGTMSAFEVASVLAEPGRPRQQWVTVPEGKRLKDLPAIFAKAGFGSEQQARAALRDVQLSSSARNSLEGFLFPDTYAFAPEATPKTVVKGLADRMTAQFTPERVASARKLGLDVYGWVTLASMVQAEAAGDAQMPIIAGVFLNRLKDGIPLGSDPTVAYGLGKDLPQLDRFAGDFTKDTPYNTYTRVGLPRGPINNPGESALLSVLSPKRDVNGKEALYFLHGKNGELRVNSTYAAHLRDLARYR